MVAGVGLPRLIGAGEWTMAHWRFEQTGRLMGIKAPAIPGGLQLTLDEAGSHWVKEIDGVLVEVELPSAVPPTSNLSH
jgi:hypothetical protein